MEEFKAGATGGSFIKDSVQKVKAQCTKKSLGEQPGYYRGFRFYSNPACGRFCNSKALKVDAYYALLILSPGGAVGSPKSDHTLHLGL